MVLSGGRVSFHIGDRSTKPVVWFPIGEPWPVFEAALLILVPDSSHSLCLGRLQRFDGPRCKNIETHKAGCSGVHRLVEALQPADVLHCSYVSSRYAISSRPPEITVDWGMWCARTSPLYLTTSPLCLTSCRCCLRTMQARANPHLENGDIYTRHPPLW